MPLPQQLNEWSASSAGAAGAAFNAVKAAQPGRLHVITSIIITCTAAAPAAPTLVQINDGSGARDLVEVSARGTLVFDFSSGLPASAENAQVQVISGVPGGAVLLTGTILGFTL